MLNNCSDDGARNFRYGVGDGEGEVFSFFVVSVDDFLVVSVDDFLVVVAASFFWVDDFLLVVSFLAGAFEGGAVVVVSVLLVLHELRSPATNRQVIE